MIDLGASPPVEELARLDALEASGCCSEAVGRLKLYLRQGFAPEPFDAAFHRLGRLYQKLRWSLMAERAYFCALKSNASRAATLNNLAVLSLESLDANRADCWLSQGLRLAGLRHDELALLLNTGCELRLFQRKPDQAACFASRQVDCFDSPRVRTNLSVCLRQLGDLKGSLDQQAIALQMALGATSLDDVELFSLIGRHRSGLEETIQCHMMLMNYAICRLSINQLDESAQQLLVAGAGVVSSSWHDPEFFSRLWRGQKVEELVIWHDQGYGDAIQNLCWMSNVSTRVDRMRLMLRPSLLRLAQQRLTLPANCTLVEIDTAVSPWRHGSAHLGLWFAPLALGGWTPDQACLGRACLRRMPLSQGRAAKKQLGVVWSAGRHGAPQPEAAARHRDVPFQFLLASLRSWSQQFDANCISLQLIDEQICDPQILEVCNSGLLIPGLPDSPDWLDTAAVVEQLDLVVTIDTAMAHLCGALGVPCVVLLNAPCDWRWGQSGDRTFLYDSLRLARCPKPGDWSGALKQATQHLIQLLC